MRHVRINGVLILWTHLQVYAHMRSCKSSEIGYGGVRERMIGSYSVRQGLVWYGIGQVPRS